MKQLIHCFHFINDNLDIKMTVTPLLLVVLKIYVKSTTSVVKMPLISVICEGVSVSTPW